MNKTPGKFRELSAEKKRKLLARLLQEEAGKANTYPLSFGQERLWFLNRLEGSGAVYNMPWPLHLKGFLDVKILERSVNEIVRRHEILRTTFDMENGKPVQVVAAALSLGIPVTDLQHLPKSKLSATVRQSVIKEFQQPFNLRKGPLLRLSLLRLGELEHVLLLVMHHIVSDAWSLSIFISEVIALYDAFEKGNPSPLPELSIQYVDFSSWQRQWFTGKVLEIQLNYWKKKLAGLTPILEFPTDHPRPPIQSYRGRIEHFQIDAIVTQKLERLSRQTGSTLFMTLLAAFAALIFRYSSQEDIAIGTPIALRDRREIETLIGFFVNTLVLRIDLSGKPTFLKLLRRVRRVALEAFRYKELPFELIVEELQPDRNLSCSPLFQVMFILQNVPIEKLELPGVTIDIMKREIHTTKFDLTLSMTNTEAGLMAELKYGSDLFDVTTITRLAEHFQILLKAIAGTPGQQVSELPLLTKSEKNRLLVEWNDSHGGYRHNRLIHELFELQVEKSSGKLALIYDDKKVTYGVLNERANQLARYLRKKGVKPNTIVGIMVNRSLEMILGILAILKAGGAYLPIDPAYPEVRKRYIFQDSQLKVLLTKWGREDKTIYMPGDIEVIKLDEPGLYQGEGSEVDNMNSSCDLVYVIYTSGSTGQPKGVMVEHRNVVNVVFWFGRKYGIKASTHVLQMSDYTFDPSVNQVFGTLLFGGVLYIISKELIFNIGLLRQYIDSHQIHILNFVPAMLADLLSFGKKLQSVQVVLSGGEKLADSIKDNIIQQGYILYNQYGPTETTIDAMVERCSQDKVTLGKPISNVRCYIFDKDKKLLPIGTPGELYIGGAGVARGYLNRAELTAEKFIENPFSIPHSPQHLPRLSITNGQISERIGTKLYRTGDLARWRPAGNIEFLGRSDQQVKIRGFRIEVGEIKNHLLGHDEIKEALVIAKEDEAGDKYLCAYVVLNNEPGQSPVSGLRDYLSKRLPGHMIPSYFVQLDELPLNVNGKAEKNLLPDPLVITSRGDIIPPRNKYEEKLAEIWSAVLGIAKDVISIDANFFELGGHSLKANSLIFAIHKGLNNRIPLTQVFKSPTISGLARYIKGAKEEIYVELKRTEKKEHYLLSSAQMRLFILQGMVKENISYNMMIVVELQGKPARRRLEKIFKSLIGRHESLRTSFFLIGKQLVQKIHEPNAFEFELEYNEIANGTGLLSGPGQQRTIDKIVREFVRYFNLSRPPLLRVRLIKIRKAKHILMIDMHHIISDGISMSIMVKELMELYRGEELPALRIQYKDYSEWQDSEKVQKTKKSQEQYWLNRFKDGVPVLNMPTDYPRLSTRGFEGDRFDFKIESDLSMRLKELVSGTGTTLNVLLLAIFNIFLSRYSGQEDIVTAVPIFGRKHQDLQNIIGMFVNMLAIRNSPGKNKTLREFLSEVKRNTLAAYDNQDYQFEELVWKLGNKKGPDQQPLIEVVFAMQNVEPGLDDPPAVEIPGLKLKPYEFRKKISKFDLVLEAYEREKGTDFIFKYRSRLFKKRTIENMSCHFKNILSGVVDNLDAKIADIEMLSEAEKNSLFKNIKKESASLIPDNFAKKRSNTREIKANFNF